MRVYLAGPMSGIPMFNIPAFDNAAEYLRSRGHSVVSPAELDGEETREYLLRSEHGLLEDYPPNMQWGDFLARDVQLITTDGIEAVVVLPGWENSKGARLETFVAYLQGIPSYTLHFAPLTELELLRAWSGMGDIVTLRGAFAYGYD